MAPMTRPEIMARIGGKNTRPERRFRAMLRAAGIRGWRCNLHGVPGTPDVAFLRERVAVFVDSCFWHACPVHGRTPKHDADFWSWKLRANSERDARVDGELASSGWRVVRFFECGDWKEVLDEVLQHVQRGGRVRARPGGGRA